MPDFQADPMERIQSIVGGEVDLSFGQACPVLGIQVSHLVRILTVLRSRPDLRFSFLTDLVVVDRPNSEKRFELNYFLMSLFVKMRLCVQITLEEDEVVDSVASIYRSAHWHEREVQEMFGIPFRTFPLLEPLFLPPSSKLFPRKNGF